MSGVARLSHQCHGTCDVLLGESTTMVNSEGNDAESTEVQFTDTDEDATRQRISWLPNQAQRREMLENHCGKPCHSSSPLCVLALVCTYLH
jgi:hypothetical protein